MEQQGSAAAGRASPSPSPCAATSAPRSPRSPRLPTS